MSRRTGSRIGATINYINIESLIILVMIKLLASQFLDTEHANRDTSKIPDLVYIIYVTRFTCFPSLPLTLYTSSVLCTSPTLRHVADEEIAQIPKYLTRERICVRNKVLASAVCNFGHMILA